MTIPDGARPALAGAVAVLVSLAAVAGALTARGDDAWAIPCWALFAVAALLHLGACGPHRNSARSMGVLLAGATFAHVVLALSPPLFSDDLYRYLVDGRLAAMGINPFAYSPDSPKLAELLSGSGGLVNHAHLRTIYPPPAQLLFALNGLLGATVLGWKMLALGALVGTAALTSRMERTGPDGGRDRSAQPVSAGMRLYTHPLAMIAVSGNGHVDIFGVAGVLGMIWMLARGRHVLAGAALAWAAGIKLFPLIAVGGAWARHRLRACVLVAGIAASLLLLSYAPVASIGQKALGSLGTYAATWQFNAGPFAVVSGTADALLEAVGVEEVVELPPLTSWNRLRGKTRVIDGERTYAAWYGRAELAAWAARGVALLVLLMTWVRVVRSEPSVVEAVTHLLFALLFFAPTVHPWYLLWLMPLAALAGNGPALLWCSTIVLAFFAPALELASGTWSDPLTVRFLEYAPVAVYWLYLRRRASV